MSAVSIAEAWPARGRPFTVSDLDNLPDDGRRYELLDGVLVVSPRPTTVHQLAASRLVTELTIACPGDLCVLAEPTVVPRPAATVGCPALTDKADDLVRLPPEPRLHRTNRQARFQATGRGIPEGSNGLHK